MTLLFTSLLMPETYLAPFSLPTHIQLSHWYHILPSLLARYFLQLSLPTNLKLPHPLSCCCSFLLVFQTFVPYNLKYIFHSEARFILIYNVIMSYVFSELPISCHLLYDKSSHPRWAWFLLPLGSHCLLISPLCVMFSAHGDSFSSLSSSGPWVWPGPLFSLSPPFS